MSKDSGDFAKALDNLKRDLRADFKTLKESVKNCNDTCDGVKELIKEMKELRREVQSLREKNEKLESENLRLNEKIEQLEQYQRANNIEIKGVPGEGDAYDVVKRIGAILKEPITDADIDICHRVPTFKPTEQNIVVRFVRREKRDKFLKESKKQRVTTKDLDYGGDSKPVYINEHLTAANKKLLGAAVARKKATNWKFVWTAGGKIFARKDEDSRAFRIATLLDVDKIN